MCHSYLLSLTNLLDLVFDTLQTHEVRMNQHHLLNQETTKMLKYLPQLHKNTFGAPTRWEILSASQDPSRIQRGRGAKQTVSLGRPTPCAATDIYYTR